jgi:signal transduction histidine kinase
LSGIAETLAGSTFPLTSPVLRQMRGLSGLDFLVASVDGAILASSGDFDVPAAVLARSHELVARDIALSSRLDLGDGTYFHVALPFQRPLVLEQTGYLHFFYPESNYRQAWWDAVLPPVMLGLSALLVVAVLSLVLAQRITRPIRGLRDVFERIAGGEFVEVPLPRRDDELLDLTRSVNQMVSQLAYYEGQVRRIERLQTLDQLGGGMAHQLRNSVTGCRMALDLHRLSCPRGECEELSVAVQQLAEMEGYLRRFLALGQQQPARVSEVSLVGLVEQILPLVEMRGRHLNVALQAELPGTEYVVKGDADALGQMLLNLLMNALEAVSETVGEGRGSGSGRRVEVRLVPETPERIRLEVWDTGPGPPPELRETLFEPLVSGKRDGVGLGLPLARDIAASHGGTLQWERVGEMTCFAVVLPILTQGRRRKEPGHGETVDRG